MQKLVPGLRVCSRYVLAEPIGGGGHGEIWSALDERNGTRVALKFLRPELCNSAEAWAVLSHESLMARRLDHPGILRTEGPMRDGDRTLLPMEFAGGGDLRRLRGQSYLRVVPVLIKIAEILAHAHERGVVHRDLKPGNVLFDESGGVRLADFGAASLAGSTASHAAGSPFSASPQQLEDRPAAPSDDIYGLGTLAYELFSGYPPFYPEFRVEQVLFETPAPLVAAREIPERLKRLVMSMLAKLPAQRPASMLDVIEGLNASLSDTLNIHDSQEIPELHLTGSPRNGADTTSLRVEPLPPPREPVRALRTSGSNKGAWLAFALLTAAVMVALIFLPRLLHTDPQPPAIAAERSATPALEAAAPDEDPAAVARKARDVYTATLAELESRQAGTWAGAGLANAKSTADAAAQAYQASQYEAASEGYAVATEALQAISAASATPLSQMLQTGDAALAAGKAALARQSYERALLIDANNAPARRGIANAAALDKALASMAQAARAEAAGQSAEAESAYAAAGKAAPFLEAPREALQRLQAGTAQTELERELARGYAALRNQRAAEARDAFEHAAQLEPGNAAAADGLKQVEAANTAQDVGSLRRQAAELERAERWREAQQQYQLALEQDPSLQFAQLGIERAQVRAELGARLDDLIARPQRLTAVAVQAQAEDSLSHARSLPEQGPVLRAQIAKLELLLQDYLRPVPVALSSDNGTDISIAPGAALGTFTHREISLTPGRYTLVGTRQGYRDVRREFEIAPGQQRLEISVACNEPI